MKFIKCMTAWWQVKLIDIMSTFIQDCVGSLIWGCKFARSDFPKHFNMLGVQQHFLSNIKVFFHPGFIGLSSLLKLSISYMDGCKLPTFIQVIDIIGNSRFFMGYSDILDGVWGEPIIQNEWCGVYGLLVTVVISKLH